MATVLDEPPVRRFTPDDLLLLPDEGKGFELIDGDLKEMNVSFLSTYVAGEIYGHLRDHVRPRRLGWVSPEGTSYRCFPDDPDQVRRADTAFHALNRLTEERARTEGHCSVVPDLVVEVVSPHDLGSDLEEKRNDWLAAGAKLVWIVHPNTRSVHAYLADGTGRVFNRSEVLSADPVLPEFRVPVADPFRRRLVRRCS